MSRITNPELDKLAHEAVWPRAHVTRCGAARRVAVVLRRHRKHHSEHVLFVVLDEDVDPLAWAQGHVEAVNRQRDADIPELRLIRTRVMGPAPVHLFTHSARRNAAGELFACLGCELAVIGHPDPLIPGGYRLTPPREPEACAQFMKPCRPARGDMASQYLDAHRQASLFS